MLADGAQPEAGHGPEHVQLQHDDERQTAQKCQLPLRRDWPQQYHHHERRDEPY